MRNYRRRFTNKRCDFCKRPATIFRVTNRGKYMLCDSPKCDLKSRIKAGLIEIMEPKRKKKGD